MKIYDHENWNIILFKTFYIIYILYAIYIDSIRLYWQKAKNMIFPFFFFLLQIDKIHGWVGAILSTKIFFRAAIIKVITVLYICIYYFNCIKLFR